MLLLETDLTNKYNCNLRGYSFTQQTIPMVKHTVGLVS